MSGQGSVSECSHLDQINPKLRPRTRGCEDCLAVGDRWVHLRMCLTCGKVGCCDDSKNTHATKHATSVGHPLVRSIEPGEDWAWCYEDEAFLEPVPQPPGQGVPVGR